MLKAAVLLAWLINPGLVVGFCWEHADSDRVHHYIIRVDGVEAGTSTTTFGYAACPGSDVSQLHTATVQGYDVAGDPVTPESPESPEFKCLPTTKAWNPDMDGDGLVGGTDYPLVTAYWAQSAPPELDADGDYVFGGIDLAMVFASWQGYTIPTPTCAQEE